MRLAPGAAFSLGPVLLVVAWATTGLAQSLVERPPNLNGTSVPTAWRSEFLFLHRFELVGEQEKKLVNYPTLTLGLGLLGQSAIGATYTSNSELGAGTTNEWELWMKRRFPLSRVTEVSGLLAYNTAAESVDGELAGRTHLGRVSLHGTVRGFSAAYGGRAVEAAAGGGLLLHLTPRLAVGGDLVRVVTDDRFPTAWSAGIHLVIPGSPHTLGFVVSNVGAATLEGASVGGEDVDGDSRIRYGFAFTVPLGTLSQWAEIFGAGRKETSTEEGVRVIVIRDVAFQVPELRIRVGERVTWVNEDPVVHTVTADNGGFDSGVIQPGERYSRSFDGPGSYSYHCLPHPFMTGVIVVERQAEDESSGQ